MLATDQIARTEQRYKERTEERQHTEAHLAAGAIIEANSPQTVRRRLEHRGMDPDTAERVVSEVAAAPPHASSEMVREIVTSAIPAAVAGAVLAPMPGTDIDPISPAAFFERILGTNDLMDARFLEEGATVARSVGRIVIGEASGLIAGYGTGVLIAPDLVMTNNHVLRSAAEAASSTLELDYEATEGGRLKQSVSFRLDPDAFFVTDSHFDYTVVAVAPVSESGTDRTRFGWVRLNPNLGKVIKGERVNIVQHPNGDPKQVALHENQVCDMLPDFLHYKTDTAPGSSGSPVFNDEWELVALHHSGVPRRDAQDRILTSDGEVWDQSMGEQHIDWVANEGARVSRIVASLLGQPLGAAQRQVLDGALAGALNPNGPRGPDGSAPRLTQGHMQSTRLGTDRSERASAPEGQATATVTIPIEITVRIGAASSAPADASMQGTTNVRSDGLTRNDGGAKDRAGPTSGAGDEERRSARNRAMSAITAARRRPYYDEGTDEAARTAWYASLDRRGRGAAWTRELQALVTERHTGQHPYSTELRTEVLYPWVDLREDRTLHGIYSDQAFAAEQLVEEDLRIDEARARRTEALLAREAATADPEHLRLELDALERALPYNCEHVVCQSWFDEREPMRGDLHHLFACESGCNSSRGNTPYFDFSDFLEAIRDNCGKRDATGDGERGRGFEPFHGKGPVARATLYFLLRYPDTITVYGVDRLNMLLAWHAADPVTTYERHRNAAIAEIQGNRNPFIDFPAWAKRVTFAIG